MDPARELEDLRSLLEAPSPAVLMTYRPDGSADVSPVWFRYTGEAFEVVVAKSDSKLRNLARDPRAVLMIFETVPPFRGVKVRPTSNWTTRTSKTFGDPSSRAISERRRRLPSLRSEVKVSSFAFLPPHRCGISPGSCRDEEILPSFRQVSQPR